MLGVEKLDEGVERVAIGALGICATGARSGNDCNKRSAHEEWEQWSCGECTVVGYIA